ncbi:hypothetical protein BJ944DRAFT_98509 [Cunninghamella echinulata]|nr:hypothetical protein BJ944DRAFT_98509 [Cunninghamella echinulata]
MAEASSAVLSDETIDQLGYARTAVLFDARTQNKTPIVAGPTKSPPPVLMPRPRPAVHPTLQLTHSFSNLMVIPSPSDNDSMDEPPLSDFKTPSPPPTTTVPATTTTTPIPVLTTQQNITSTFINNDNNGNHNDDDNSISLKQIPIQKTSTKNVASPQKTTQIEEMASAPKVSPKHDTNTTIKLFQQNQISNASPSNSTNTTPPKIAITSSTSTPLVKFNDIVQYSSSGTSKLVLDQLQQQTQQPSSILNNNNDNNNNNVKKTKPILERPHLLRKSASSDAISSKVGDEPIVSKPNNNTIEQQRRYKQRLQYQQLHQIQQQYVYQNRSNIQSQHHHHHNNNDSNWKMDDHNYNNNRIDNQNSSIGNNRNTNGQQQQQQQQQQQKQQQYHHHQENLLRENRYLRQKISELQADKMETERFNQEISYRLQKLEVKIEEKKQAAAAAAAANHVNEYQHHHYYHHNPSSIHSNDKIINTNTSPPPPPPPTVYTEYDTYDENVNNNNNNIYNHSHQPMNISQHHLHEPRITSQPIISNHEQYYTTSNGNSNNNTYNINDNDNEVSDDTIHDNEQFQRQNIEEKNVLNNDVSNNTNVNNNNNDLNSSLRGQRLQQQQKQQHMTSPNLSASGSASPHSKQQQQQPKKVQDQHASHSSLSHKQITNKPRRRSKSVPKNTYFHQQSRLPSSSFPINTSFEKEEEMAVAEEFMMHHHHHPSMPPPHMTHFFPIHGPPPPPPSLLPPSVPPLIRPRPRSADMNRVDIIDEYENMENEYMYEFGYDSENENVEDVYDFANNERLHYEQYVDNDNEEEVDDKGDEEGNDIEIMDEAQQRFIPSRGPLFYAPPPPPHLPPPLHPPPHPQFDYIPPLMPDLYLDDYHAFRPQPMLHKQPIRPLVRRRSIATLKTTPRINPALEGDKIIIKTIVKNKLVVYIIHINHFILYYFILFY